MSAGRDGDENLTTGVGTRAGESVCEGCTEEKGTGSGGETGEATRATQGVPATCTVASAGMLVERVK